MAEESEIEMFQAEAEELFDVAESSLIALDKGEGFGDHYKQIFRAFHSVKGAAGMFCLSALQKHMHHLEDLLAKYEKKGTFNTVLISYFLKGIDAARKILVGTSVAFDLIDPVAADAPISSLPEFSIKKEPKESQKASTIYIVDDEPEIVELLTEILNEDSVCVKGFTNSNDLLRAAEVVQPDVIFCDYVMPGLDGVELLKQIRQLNPDIPVVFVSGNVSPALCIKAIDLGAYSFIQKPFDEARVRSISRNALRRHQLLKLLDKSIRLVMYQFSDLENFLMKNDKTHICETIKKELEFLVQQRRLFKENSKMVV